MDSLEYFQQNKIKILNKEEMIGKVCYYCKEEIKDKKHECLSKFRAPYIVMCLNCKKLFVVGWIKSRSKTCCSECRNELISKTLKERNRINPIQVKRLIKAQCAWCGSNLSLHPYRLRKTPNHFCSKYCFNQWIKKKWEDNPELLSKRTEKMRITREKTMSSRLNKFIKFDNRKQNRIEFFIDWLCPGAKYTGNRSFCIQFKNGKNKFPDFVVNPIEETKKIIEVAGNYWHTKEEMNEVVRNYREVGYDCLVIWEEEIYNAPNQVINKIRKFTKTMTMGIFKIDKGLPNPRFAYKFDSGFDLYSVANDIIPPNSHKIIPCGVVLIIPNHIEVQIRGRSGLAKKGILCHFGTVDSQFRGELGPILFNTTNEPFYINRGDRVCQAVVSPKLIPQVPFNAIELIEVNSIEETDRGEKGFGSSGK